MTERKVDVDSLLHCAPSALHSGLSVVRDPTTGMLMDFTEVCHKNTFFTVFFLSVSTSIISLIHLELMHIILDIFWLFPP